MIFRLTAEIAQYSFFESTTGVFQKQRINRGKCRGWQKLKWILKCTGYTIYTVGICRGTISEFLLTGATPLTALLVLAGGYLCANAIVTTYYCWKNEC